jgi:hypothetical protein
MLALCRCRGTEQSNGIAVIVVDTGDSEERIRPATSEGTLYLSLDFGSVARGVQELTDPLFKNIGSGDLTILGLAHSSGDPDFSVDMPGALLLVADGPGATIPVHFAPGFTTGRRTAQFLLSTDSERLPFIELDLSGIAIRPSVILDPQTLDFGDVVVGTTETRSLLVTNQSGLDVEAIVGEMKGTDPLLFGTQPSSGTTLRLYEERPVSVSVTYAPLVPSQVQSQAYFSMDLCSNGTGCHALASVRGRAVTAR